MTRSGGRYFRKKPVVVEAHRVPVEGVRHQARAYARALGEWCGAEVHDDGSLLIITLEGDMRADPGDWIIKGVQGEFYPCKPEIFLATYERVADPGDIAKELQGR
jgi:hypothetical protein